ncbi:MAG: acyl-CoA synthetase (AMP-forming)/AMP-acid ligase [Actinomycetia bacterium]|nr:acyl-CoA synthetase (AMP-forming)/AMP-acid ligase [Actinomycetes bacterium]
MNLAAVLLATAESDPDRPALTGPEPVSYAQLAARAAGVASVVAERADPGDRVAIVAGNETAFVVAYLGTLLGGAVAVPLNVGSPSHELARELETVEPVLVLASTANADLARRAVSPPGARFEESSEESSTRGIPVVVVDDGTPENSPGNSPAKVRAVSKDASDLAVLLFTAGTAGAPKPAMLTHGALLANLEQMQSHPGLRVDATDVVLGVLPLFHVYGLNVVIGLALRAGAAVALVDHFHPVETMARVRGDRVTVLAGVPAIYDAWAGLDEEAAPRDSFAAVRLCVSGAATLHDGTRSAMHDRFGVTVHDGYGLTEASPVVTTTAVAAVPKPGSIGPPLPGIEVRLLDREGNPALEDDPGQIVVRGANVFVGYWNDATATAAVLVDGWLHTGDVAVADADGWLTLVDRAKDVVIVSGFNVYPGEVEDALRSHRDVEDVAVIGEPHPRTGETVVAYVVARPGSNPDPVELLRHAGRQLARYKLPTRVELVESLPRTLAGKLVRRALSSSPSASEPSSAASTESDAGRPADDATTKPA